MVNNVYFPAKAVSTLRYTEAPQVVAVEEELLVSNGETVSLSFVDVLMLDAAIAHE